MFFVSLADVDPSVNIEDPDYTTNLWFNALT